MSWQQLAKEGLARGLGPLDQVQALVERAHQDGQLGQEGLARLAARLGLHAHHQLAAQQAQTQGAFGLLLVARGQHDGLAPDLRQEFAQEVVHGHRCQLLLQLLHVALLQAQVGFLAGYQQGGVTLGLQ